MSSSIERKASKFEFRKIGILCGVSAPVLWVSSIVFCAAIRPEYSHYRQYISELGERGSSTELIMRYTAFVPTGLMHIVFAVFLMGAFRSSRLAALAATLLGLNGLARIGAGFFPCEVGCSGPRLLLSQQLHTLSGSVGFVALVVATILWAAVLKRDRSLQDLTAYSVGSGVLGLVFLLLMLWSAEHGTARGLFERLSSGVLSLWILVFAVRLWPRHATKCTS